MAFFVGDSGFVHLARTNHVLRALLLAPFFAPGAPRRALLVGELALRYRGGASATVPRIVVSALLATLPPSD